VLACLTFTSLCVTAMLLGHRSSNVTSRAVAGVVAAACMLPCRIILPRLYKSANAPLDDDSMVARMHRKAQGGAKAGRVVGWKQGPRGVSIAEAVVASRGPRPGAASHAVAPVSMKELADRRRRISSVVQVHGGGGDGVWCGAQLGARCGGWE
jgi:hypothetical protein